MIIIRLKFERLRKGLSQYHLGLAARVDQTAISQMELGNYYPGRKILGRLAAVLGVPADELLKTVSIGGEPTRHRPRDAAGRYV